MKKNNKGFFLAETIVMIALISTVMAFVYPNVSKLYENYKNKTIYYDQTEDIYTLRAVYEYLYDMSTIAILTRGEDNGIAGCKIFKDDTPIENIIASDMKFGGLTKLYITGYMTKPIKISNENDKDNPEIISNTDYEFNKYINHLKKTTYDTTAYRLIGIFNEDDKIRYASIKIDNPNPNRNCNLGGDISETAS